MGVVNTETSAAAEHTVSPAADLGFGVRFVAKDEYLKTLTALRSEGFEMCVDLTAVDYLTHPGRTLAPEVNKQISLERFEIVVNLLSLSQRRRVRLRVQVAASDTTIDSAFDLYPGTEAMEREVFDMFGVTFNGHPDLTRILMPEDWVGYPLRKDYSQGEIPVQFKGAAS